ncbi:glycosyltransferase family 2 protein, partial [Candidatus Gottesmanbacteria bacterium]|nr:glycosyltransferase family 2 protein [Candidatus Gottesmanbacteria bacterium]
MDLSLIIPSYNTSALLERCLTSIFTSLKRSEISYEVIVVDNSSDDGSPESVRKKFPQVHLLCNTENVGYGKANNQAIKFAKGDYVLLLNSDIIVQNDAIGALYQFIRDKRKAFAGGKLLNEDGSPQP